MSDERSNPFDVDDLLDPKPAKPPLAKPVTPAPTPIAASPTPEAPTGEAAEPRPPAPERPSRAQIEQLARDTGFISRERPRMGRRHRTGRDRQLNLKVRTVDLDDFYAFADREGITLGEAFERAVSALKALSR
ncbi:MAG TPA: hypothetical protein VND94_18900 [Terriglobia bacterium]|nr:hypothetical protein [Terriglobia bacterium]